MRKTGLIALALLLAGCASAPMPGPPPTGEGDLSYLIKADPNDVTIAALSSRAVTAEEHLQKYCYAEGIVWQAYYSKNELKAPDLYGSGGDSLLFTGYYMAACCYRYAVTKDPKDLERVVETMRGLYILTHCSGVRGVLARCAFPTATPKKWQYPELWGGRIEDGFVYTGPADLADPFHPGQMLPQMTFYTRVTRDNISGLLFGLSAAMKVLDVSLAPDILSASVIRDVRKIAASTVVDVWYRLKQDDWVIKDQTGRNDTAADDMGGLLKLVLLGLTKEAAKEDGDPGFIKSAQKHYDEAYSDFDSWGFYFGDIFNRFTNTGKVFGFPVGQYYAWNLRHGRVLAAWQLADNDAERDALSKYLRNWIFKHVAGHKNAFFTFAYNATTKTHERLDEGLWALKSQSLRPFRGWCSPVSVGSANPYDPPGPLSRFFGFADDDVLPPQLKEPTTYFTWQEDPWSAGIQYDFGMEENVGIDFLLPYWLGRYYGLVPAK